MVHVGEISFCERVAFNIKSDDAKKRILDRIKSKYNLAIIARHYRKYDAQSARKINDNPHMCCLRSNGNPYFLFLTKINFVNYCVFIDKKIQQGYYFPRMIMTNYQFADALFSDTIFDGEMVKKQDGKKWVFLVHDLVVREGAVLGDLSVVQRLNEVYRILDTGFCQDDMAISEIRVKSYFDVHDLEHVLSGHRDSLDYTCRGVYFVPMTSNYKSILVNFDDALVVKSRRPASALAPSSPDNVRHQAGRNAVFNARKSNLPDVYSIYDTQTNELVGTACIDTLAASRYMSSIFEDKNMADSVKLLFEYSDVFRQWTPVAPGGAHDST